MYRLSQLFVTLFAVALSTGLQGQQVTARVAGLESNAKYMSLLEQEQRLHRTEDSVVQVINDTRKLFTAETTDSEKEQLGTKILQLEKELFEIRNQQGVTANEIGAIEQDFILKNLNGTAENPAAAGTPAPAGGKQTPNLVYNVYFKENLSEQDYKALRHAQELEPLPLKLLGTYLENYRKADSLATLYDTTANKTLAEETYAQLESIGSLNRALSDSLSHVWNYIYDNKTYAYNYLLDKMGEEKVLAREEEALSEASRQLSALQGETASDAVADYFLRKRVVVDYEAAVAGVLALDAARDSLRGVAAQLESIDYRLPRIEVAERYFLDYDSVAFSSKPVYTYQNPIPECRVYANGTIYRILLGTFNTKRAAATFRGAYPLFYLINDEGKWCYYAGGFATLAEAEAAQALLKKRGFVRPEIVVWTDGTARNLSLDPEAAKVTYRVEITGTDALSDEVKGVIAATGEGYELSRVGSQLFVVGAFDDKAVADRLAESIRQTDAALEVKVAEIAE